MLTKTLFKLAMECPVKVHYARDYSGYSGQCCTPCFQHPSTYVGTVDVEPGVNVCQ